MSGKTVIMNAGNVRVLLPIHRELNYTNYTKLFIKFPVLLGINTSIAVTVDIGIGNICMLEPGWA